MFRINLDFNDYSALNYYRTYLEDKHVRYTMLKGQINFEINNVNLNDSAIRIVFDDSTYLLMSMKNLSSLQVIRVA